VIVLWWVVDEGVVDRYVKAHDTRGRLEDDGRDEEDFWLKRSAARHLRRSHPGIIVVVVISTVRVPCREQ